MATVNVYTAERMKAIEDNSIAAASIVSGRLILQKHDGSLIDAGPVGSYDGLSPSDLAEDPAFTDMYFPLPSGTPGAGKVAISTGSGTASAWGEVPGSDSNVPWLNVKIAPFGALGDGVTDDTVAIQSALDAAAASTNGAVVYFPPGVYRHTANIAIEDGANITLRGDGQRVSVIKGDWPGPDGEDRANFSFTTCTGIRVFQLGVTQEEFNYRGTGGGITFWSCGDVSVEDCHIWHCTGAGIAMTACSTGRMANNLIHNTGSGAIDCNSSSYIAISENVIYQSGDDSIGFNGSGGPSNFCHDCTAVGNVIGYSGGCGVAVWAGQRISIVGNTTDGTYNCGILVTQQYNCPSGDISILGNIISNSGDYVTPPIYGAGAMPAGIAVAEDNSTNKAYRIKIADNLIIGGKNSFIRIGNRTKQSLIEEIHIIDNVCIGPISSVTPVDIAVGSVQDDPGFYAGIFINGATSCTIRGNHISKAWSEGLLVLTQSLPYQGVSGELVIDSNVFKDCWHNATSGTPNACGIGSGAPLVLHGNLVIDPSNRLTYSYSYYGAALVAGEYVVADNATDNVPTFGLSGVTGGGSSDDTFMIEYSGHGDTFPWWSPTFVASDTQATLDISFAAQLRGQAWAWHTIAVGIPGPSGRIKTISAPSTLESGASLVAEFPLATHEAFGTTTSATTIVVEGLTPGTRYTVEFNQAIIGGSLMYTIPAGDFITDMALSSNEDYVLTTGVYTAGVGVWIVGASDLAHYFDEGQQLRYLGKIPIVETGYWVGITCCPTPNNSRAAVLSGDSVVIVDFDSMSELAYYARPGASNLVHLAWRTGTDTIYVTDDQGHVYTLNATTGTWSSAIVVGGGSDYLGYISIQPDGTKAWVSNRTAGSVRSIALPSHTLGTARVVGGGSSSSPEQCQAMPDGTVWVACKVAQRLDHVNDAGVIAYKAATHPGPYAFAAMEDNSMAFYAMQASSGALLYYSYFHQPTLGTVENGNQPASPTSICRSMLITKRSYHVFMAWDSTLFKWPQAVFRVNSSVGDSFPDRNFGRMVVTGGTA